MGPVPQAMTSGRDKALSIHQKILNLLNRRPRERKYQTILIIGELLTEFKDGHYYDDLGGYKSFVQYVKDDLHGKVEYSLATRYMKIYTYFKRHPDEHPQQWLTNLGISHLYLLVENANKGEVKPALWRNASKLTYKQLRHELGSPTGEPPPISDDDASLHTKLKLRIKEIGDMLGKYAQTEYPCSSNGSQEQYPRLKPRPCDVIWKDSPQAPQATHAFEVQHRGGLDHALVTLVQAHNNLHARPFLIVTPPNDTREAIATAHDMFPQIANILTVFAKDQIDRLYNNLAGVRADLNTLTHP